MMKNSPTIAFIAQYAPPAGSVAPMEATFENVVYSKYHFDIYSILKSNFPNVVTGNDANFIIENHDKIDYIFTLLNRAPYRNSEVFISSLAEYYKLPYLGARPNIRALAEDKHLAKIMASFCGISTPLWITVDVGEKLHDTLPFAGPYFVKPRYGASSKYIDEDSICQTWQDVQRRVTYLHKNNEDAIIEEFVDGIYYSSPVIFEKGTPRVLPPIREKSTLKGNVVTYLQKRKITEGLSRTVETSPEVIEKITEASQTIAHYIQPIDYTRIDYIVKPSGELVFLELNVCCNLGVQSAFVMSAQSVGISHSQLVMSILSESFWRQDIS